MRDKLNLTDKLSITIGDPGSGTPARQPFLARTKEKFGFWREALRLSLASWSNLAATARSLAAGVTPYGRVLVYIPGECCNWHPNLVVNSGRYHVADQLAAKDEAVMNYMAVGTGSTAVLSTDTALEDELDRNVLASKTRGSGSNADQITYICTFPAGEATGLITEGGIFNAASGGIMLNRAVWPGRNKPVNKSMTLIWVLTIAPQ